MATLEQRVPYTDEELKKLYPSSLKLHLVQVLHRHGERAPTGPRFENAGVPKFWPYCSTAQEMVSSILEPSSNGTQWTPLHWHRRIEMADNDDRARLATGPNGENHSLCKMGELTDVGRITTYKLGQRIRHLYVDQLKFLPKNLEDTNIFYLRASTYPRALESLQQVFRGMYPTGTRASSLKSLIIHTRNSFDENLFPNYSSCKRFAQLSKAFHQRAADRWNKTTEMEYVNKILGKWMPENSKTVAVDSHPRLSGIFDAINSTMAHGAETKLPNEFYGTELRKIIEKICVEEWYSGYQESQEYRTLGIGSLMGDIVDRMTNSIESLKFNKVNPIVGKDKKNAIKFAIYGCHDYTLAAILMSLGAFRNSAWPPFTSHIALELFQRSTPPVIASTSKINSDEEKPENLGTVTSLLNKYSASIGEAKATRKTSEDYKNENNSILDDYFVRVRYNDEVMIIPGCRTMGNHLKGDESFCSLKAFKNIVDQFVPRSLKDECQANLNESAFSKTIQPAGY